MIIMSLVLHSYFNHILHIHPILYVYQNPLGFNGEIFAHLLARQLFKEFSLHVQWQHHSYDDIDLYWMLLNACMAVHVLCH